MAESARKLCYRRGGVDYSITLYTDVADVGNEYARVRVDGVDLYAGLGPLSDPLASHMRVRKGGVDYAYLFEALQPLPVGFIGMFAGSCPAGWTREDAFDNRFVRGAATYGGTGGATSHFHYYSVPAAVSNSVGASVHYRWLSGSGTHGNFIQDHTHRYPGVGVNSTHGSNYPLYRNIVFCRKV